MGALALIRFFLNSLLFSFNARAIPSLTVLTSGCPLKFDTAGEFTV